MNIISWEDKTFYGMERMIQAINLRIGYFLLKDNYKINNMSDN